jgi:hypothetical protein
MLGKQTRTALTVFSQIQAVCVTVVLCRLLILQVEHLPTLFRKYFIGYNETVGKMTTLAMKMTNSASDQP